METRQIPRTEWKSFFDVFSRQHEGWLATLEIFSPEIGAQEEARELPLEGVTLQGSDEPEAKRGSQTGSARGVAVAINLGTAPDDHVSHIVVEPTHVWLEQTREGANAALEIESEDETKTLLRFRSSLPPEMVDGIVLE